MAIVWGALSKRAQLGIDLSMSPATVGPGTSSVTLTWTIYLRTTYAYAGTYGLQRTGTAPTGTTNVTFSTSNGQTTTVQLWQGTENVSTSYTPGAVTRSLTATLPASGTLFDGAKPTVTRGFTIPTRPPSAPSAPTSATAAYVADNRIDVSWVRPADASNAATIWSNVRIYRRTATNSALTLVATLPGLSGTSWSDTTVTGNQAYQYEVRGSNVTGESTSAATAWASTTPAAPSNVTAAKNSAGNIVVTWQNNANVSALVNFELQDEETTIASPTAGATSYTHTSPNPSVTHRYRIRAIAVGSRPSSWSAYSNTVQLLAAPAAPTNLAPNGVAWPSDETLTLSWQHNPVDTTPQTAYELQHRLVGSGTWTTLSGTTALSRTLTGYSSGQSVEWRVRTKGAHADWSPYSAVATFSIAARPTATISSPGASVTAPSVTVTWAYFQAQSQAQSAWEVEIVEGATLIASGAGAGTTSSWASPNVLADGGSYTIRVRVRSSAGLWSSWATLSISVDYLEPAPSDLTAQWQDGYGNVLLSATAVSDGTSPETVSQSIERSTDGGNTWVTLADGLGIDATLVDWQSPSAGTFHYRVKAFSALPSMAETIVEVTVPDTPINCVVWISGGPGFALAYPIRHNPEIALEGGRDRTLHDFDGRTYPVEHSSTSVPRVLSVSGSIMPDSYTPSTGGAVSTREGLEDLFDMPGPHLYRDPTGRVMYGTVSALRWTRSPGGLGQVSFTITRSAPPTDAQASSMTGWFAPRIAQVAPGVYAFINADAEAAAPGVFEEVV